MHLYNFQLGWNINVNLPRCFPLVEYVQLVKYLRYSTNNETPYFLVSLGNSPLVSDSILQIKSAFSSIFDANLQKLTFNGKY